MSTLSISPYCLLILYLSFHCSDHRDSLHLSFASLALTLPECWPIRFTSRLRRLALCYLRTKVVVGTYKMPRLERYRLVQHTA